MAYIVENMTLIPQAMTGSCWYASAQMVIMWKSETMQQSFKDLIPPELDSECAKIRDANKGLQNPQILSMAKRLGLAAVPPLSPTPEALKSWLQMYGPLWVNGKSHIVVIAGITEIPGSGTQLLVYDPWPVNVGKIDWRSLQDWYALGSTISSRDTGRDVEAVFLHCP